MYLKAPTNFEDYGIGVHYDANKPLGGLPIPSRFALGSTVFWNVYTAAHTLSFGTHWFWAANNGSFTGSHYFGCANRLTTGVWNHSLSCDGTDFISTDAIVLGRWYRQALRRRQVAGTGTIYDYFYDLPDLTKVISTTRSSETVPMVVSTDHELCLFSNTWSSGDESLDGMIDRMKWYDAPFSNAEILLESGAPWPVIAKYFKYLYGCWPNISNLDLRDVSGKGHHFSILRASDPTKFVDSVPPTSVPTYAPQLILPQGAGSASSAVTGSGAPAGQNATVAGNGIVSSIGTGAPAAQAATVSGAGKISAVGTGAPAAQAATVAGAGVVSSVGTGALTAQSATASGAGIGKSIGTGAPAAQNATVVGAGVVGNVIAGTGTPAAQAATVAGAGMVSSIGTGALVAQNATTAGVGVGKSIGTGAPAAQSATVVGSGVVGNVIAGVGALQAGSATTSGAGVGSSIGTGAPAAQSATVVGAGVVGSNNVIGIGTVFAQAASVVGAGITGSRGSGVLQAQPATVQGGDLRTPGSVIDLEATNRMVPVKRRA